MVKLESPAILLNRRFVNTMTLQKHRQKWE
jgi:hypothetical protein